MASITPRTPSSFTPSTFKMADEECHSILMSLYSFNRSQGLVSVTLLPFQFILKWRETLIIWLQNPLQYLTEYWTVGWASEVSGAGGSVTGQKFYIRSLSGSTEVPNPSLAVIRPFKTLGIVTFGRKFSCPTPKSKVLCDPRMKKTYDMTPGWPKMSQRWRKMSRD